MSKLDDSSSITSAQHKHILPKKLSPNYFLAFEGRLTKHDFQCISEFDFGCEVDKETINALVQNHVELPWPSNRKLLTMFVRMLYKEIGGKGMSRLAKHLMRLCNSRRNEEIPFCGYKTQFWWQFHMKSKELSNTESLEGASDVTASILT